MSPGFATPSGRWARSMAEVRAQAAKGIVPPKFNFAPVRADAKRVIAGRAVRGRARIRTLLADFRKKVDSAGRSGRRQGAADRRRDARRCPARSAGRSTTCWRRSTRSSRWRRAMTAPGACRAAPNIMPARLRAQTTTDLTADEIHQLGLDEVRADPRRDGGDQGAGRLQGHAPAILRPHQERAAVQISEHRRGPAGHIWPTRNAFIAQVMAEAPQYVQPAAQGAARGSRGRDVAAGDGLGRLLQPALARRLAAGHLSTSTSPT